MHHFPIHSVQYLCIMSENRMTYTHQLEFDMGTYMGCLLYTSLLVPKLSVTFNSNYSNLVGSDASSSLHMKMKRTQLSLACKSSENLVRQIDVLFNHIDVKLISQMIRRNHLFLFAPTGRMLRFSGNGRNTLKESTKQVWCYLIAKYMWRINEPDTVKTGTKSRSKTDTTPITISLNSYGCPKVPKVTPNRSCPPKTKTVQIMLREYLKAHILSLIHI